MKTNILRATANAILAAEERHQYKLSETDREVLHTALVEFVMRATDKYILGAKEHGGSITSMAVLRELSDELVDAWMYRTALKFMMKGL